MISIYATFKTMNECVHLAYITLFISLSSIHSYQSCTAYILSSCFHNGNAGHGFIKRSDNVKVFVKVFCCHCSCSVQTKFWHHHGERRQEQYISSLWWYRWGGRGSNLSGRHCCCLRRQILPWGCPRSKLRKVSVPSFSHLNISTWKMFSHCQQFDKANFNMWLFSS